MKKINTRGIAVAGILGAVGFVLMLLEFPISFLIPPFIKFDFSELPALIAAFSFGPTYGVLVCLIKNLLHLFATTTMGVGELSNFVLGAIFVFIAGYIYKYHKDRNGALIGCVAGSVVMAIISVATNYFVVYPAFSLILTCILILYVKAYLTVADAFLIASSISFFMS